MLAGRQQTEGLPGEQQSSAVARTPILVKRYRTPQRIEPKSGNPTVRLLVVDDHSVVRHGATSWLQAQPGFEVVGEAGTAAEAIALAIFLKPDVVVLDVGLRDEGGLSAAYKIVRTCKATKVVAFSASSDTAHLKGMIAAGASAYVLKTSEPPTLLSAIRSVLVGSRFLDPALSDAVIEELDTFPEPEAWLSCRSHSAGNPSLGMYCLGIYE
jgi:DNA-binding NarL/FixJ family response regulator